MFDHNRQSVFLFELILNFSEDTVDGFIVGCNKDKTFSEIKISKSVLAKKGRILEATKEVLNSLAKEIVNLAKKEGSYIKVGKAKVILSYPWFQFEKWEEKEEYKKPTTITQSMVEAKLRTLEERFIPKNLAQDEDSVHILESYISYIKMKGYTVDNPIGKKTSDLDVKYGIAYTKESFVNDAKRVITENTNIKKIHFISINRALSIYMMNKDKDTALFTYPQRRFTYVGKISRSGRASSLELLHGIDDVLGILNATNGKSKNLALSKLNMTLDDIIEEDEKSKNISEVVSEWSDEFKKAISTLNLSILKIEVYSICDETFFKFIDKTIKNSINIKSNLKIGIEQIVNTLSLYDLE